jgi:hypothetical protein
MAARQRIQAQEQFIPFENYRSEWDQPRQLELFKEEEQAEILDVLNSDSRLHQYPNDIEPLDSEDL